MKSARDTDIQRPLRISIETDLDFSRIANNSGGSVMIDPRSGARTTSGGTRDLGGMPVRGTVLVEGEPGRAIRIDLPSSVQLTGASGGQADIFGLRTNLTAAPRIGIDGRLSFSFGGELRISLGLSGELRGRIPITVDYL